MCVVCRTAKEVEFKIERTEPIWDSVVEAI